MKIGISTFGSTNKEAGWNNMEIEIEGDTASLAEALQLAKLQDGRSLLELIGENSLLKDSFAIFLSGTLLWHPVDLEQKIRNGDKLMILDFPFTLGGG